MLDGTPRVGWTELSPTLAVGLFEGLDIGLDRRAPVFRELYHRHGVFRYSGTISDVVITPSERAST